MIEVITTLITVALMVALGSVARSLNIVPPTAAPLLNNIVMSFFMPALVFSGIKSTQDKALTPDLLRIPVVAYLTIGACGLIAFGIGKYVFRMPRPQLGAFLLTSMFGSTAFIGVPLIKGLYGNKQLLQHSFYSELGSLLLLVSVAIVIASYYGERTYTEKPSFWRNLLAVPKSGPFLGMVLGLLFYTETIPKPLLDTLSTLSQGTLPVMMFSLGLTIVWKDIRNYFAKVLAMNFVKLIIAPIIGLALARYMGMDTTTQGVILLDSATPAIVICLAYAAEYKLDREFASTCIFSSFFFALFTLPVISFFFLPH
jgi:predicted permease